MALVLVVALLLSAPSTLLQLGLRDATAPWFFTNDSTYQIELGGDLLLDLDNPYGHDYRDSGLERFYTRDGSVSERVREREVALEHFAYFPGQRAASARALATAARAPRRLPAAGAAGHPRAACRRRWSSAARSAGAWRSARCWCATRSPCARPGSARTTPRACCSWCWPSRWSSRRRFVWAAAALAGAVLLKQFALVALPFLALMMLKQGAGALKRAPALAFGGVLAAGVLPFLIADPVAFCDDTVRYGAGTYKIVGYGLSGILVRLGILEDRDGAYPFALVALLTWVPLTVWLLYAQRRASELWLGAAAFAVSILWLMFIGRTFNNYYLVWPMTGAVVAALMALGGPGAAARSRPG